MYLVLKGATVVAKKASPAKDGVRVYYSLQVAQNGDVFPFSCSDAVYRAVDEFKKYDLDLNYTRNVWDGKVRERIEITYCSEAE